MNEFVLWVGPYVKLFFIFLPLLIYIIYLGKIEKYDGKNIFPLFIKKIIKLEGLGGELIRYIITFILMFTSFILGSYLYENIPIVKETIKKEEVKEKLRQESDYNFWFYSAYEDGYKTLEDCGGHYYSVCEDFVLGITGKVNYDTGLKLSEEMDFKTIKSCNYFSNKSEGYEGCIDYVEGSKEDKQYDFYKWFKESGSTFNKNNVQINWGENVTKDDIEYLKEGNNYTLLIEKLLLENK